jgi:hypothetical protein
MEKMSFLSTVMVLVSFILSACGLNFVIGSGKIVNEVRSVSNFERVSTSGSIKLFLEQGDHEALKIETDDNLLPYVRSEVNNGLLKIYIDHTGMQCIHPSRQIHVYVTAKNISGVELSGSVQMVSDEIVTRAMNIDIGGSGEMIIKQLQADTLTARISGSGKCELAGGETVTQKIIISGSGVCDTTKLVSQVVNVTVSGSGKALIRADDSLDARVSGSGNVAYVGNPKVVQDISGSGSIYQQNKK